MEFSSRFRLPSQHLRGHRHFQVNRCIRFIATPSALPVQPDRLAPRLRIRRSIVLRVLGGVRLLGLLISAFFPLGPISPFLHYSSSLRSFVSLIRHLQEYSATNPSPQSPLNARGGQQQTQQDGKHSGQQPSNQRTNELPLRSTPNPIERDPLTRSTNEPPSRLTPNPTSGSNEPWSLAVPVTVSRQTLSSFFRRKLNLVMLCFRLAVKIRMRVFLRPLQSRSSTASKRRAQCHRRIRW